MDHVRNKQIRTGLWTTISIGAAIILLLVLSSINNPDGTPWLESTLIGQTLAMLGVVAAAVLPSLIATRRDAAVAREQLENSHVEDSSKVSNVRDDLDHKHGAVMDAVAELAARMERKFDGVYAEFRGTRGDIGRAARQADAARDAADTLRDKVDVIAGRVSDVHDRIDSVEAKVDGIVQVTTGNIPVVEEQEES